MTEQQNNKKNLYIHFSYYVITKKHIAKSVIKEHVSSSDKNQNNKNEFNQIW